MIGSREEDVLLGRGYGQRQISREDYMDEMYTLLEPRSPDYLRMHQVKTKWQGAGQACDPGVSWLIRVEGQSDMETIHGGMRWAQ